MDEQFYKKSGIVLRRLAREFFVMEEGDRTPSVAEYSERLSVSRGLVQNAIGFLQQQGAIEAEKSYGRGTWLTRLNREILLQHTGWDVITFNLPLPLNEYLVSLTTALYAQKNSFPIPISTVYATGAENRLHYLQKRSYDVIIVSRSTADIFIRDYDFVEYVAPLTGCRYAGAFYLYFTSPEERAIRDGMKIALDATCTDQVNLLRPLCEGKQVEYIDIPYIGQHLALKGGAVDCVLVRREALILELDYLNPQQTAQPGFTPEDTATPVMLVHRDNHSLGKVLQKYMQIEELAKWQADVLEGRRDISFY